MANSGKGVRNPMRTRGRQRRHKPRLCRCCGREMEPTQVWICTSCEAAGRTVPRARGVQSGAELLAIARAREAAEEPILEGWGLDEIEALARYLWDNGAKAYGSYGKLRGWCDNVGRLPPVPMQVILRDGRVYEERAYCPTDARLAVAAHGDAGWEDVMDAKVAISTAAMRAAGYLPKP